MALEDIVPCPWRIPGCTCGLTYLEKLASEEDDDLDYMSDSAKWVLAEDDE